MSTDAPTATFDVLWRHGSSDTVITTFTHAYSSAMSQYEETHASVAVNAVAGDLLVLRVSVGGSNANALYIPYGDSPPTATARYLTLDLP